MTDTINISRELLEQICVELEHDNDRYMLGRELRKALATPPADAADMGGQAGEEVGEPMQVFTCQGKGGEYVKLGYAKPAGAIKAIQGDSGLMVYMDTATKQLYFRDPTDFRQRMVPLGTVEPCSLGGDLIRQMTLADILAQHRQQAGKLVGALGLTVLALDQLLPYLSKVPADVGLINEALVAARPLLEK